MKCCELPVESNLNHCARCHETFRGLSQFDAHQDVDYDRLRPVVCLAPVSLGMVRDHRGVWTSPEGAAQALAQSRRLAAANSRRRHAAA